jgi:hypothetical protein
MRPKSSAAAVLASCLLGLGVGQAPANVLSSFRLIPASTQTGANPDVTADLTFDYGANTTDSVRTVTINLAPGLIASILNVPATCTQDELTAIACPPGSQIGNGTATVNGTPYETGLYLMPPPTAADGAGFGTVVRAGGNAYTGVGTLDVISVGGQPVGEVKLGVPLVNNEQVDELRATMSATTADGRPFTRVPTSCSTATSTVSVETKEFDVGSGSDSFDPTGCSAMGYAPALSAVQAIKDPNDDGVELIASLSQPNAMTESATKALELHWPPGLVPDAAAVATCLSGTPCTIGTATATSWLAPPAYLSSGTVTLGGTPSAPTLTVAWPAPVPLSITGAIDVVNRTVRFPNVPDLPLGGLTIDISGPAGAKVLATTCAPGDAVATFTPQSGGATVTSTQPVAYRGCPGVRPRPRPKPPRPTPLRISIRNRGMFVFDARANIRLACTGGSAGDVCRGSVSLTRHQRIVRRVRGRRTVVHRTVLVARARYAIERGQTETDTPPLTAAGLRLLEHARHHRLRVRATATLRGGVTAHRTMRLELSPRSS